MNKDHQIATVAHAICSADGEESFNKITIQTCNSKDEITGETLTSVEVHIPKSYRDSRDTENNDIEHDYALITVEEDLSDYVHFALSTSYNVLDIIFDRVPIYVTGRNYVSKNKNNELYTDEGRVYTSSVDTSFVLRYNTDAPGEESGAPVYTITKQILDGEESYIYTVLAIHSGPGAKDSSGNYLYNNGVRMTKYQVQFYSGNVNAKY